MMRLRFFILLTICSLNCFAQTKFMAKIGSLAILKADVNSLRGLAYINIGDSAIISKMVDDKHWNAIHNGVEGLLNEAYILQDENYLAYKRSVLPIPPKPLTTAQKKALLVKKYGLTYASLIMKREIRIGMTKAMVLDSWGKPEDINRTVGRWGVHEQWVYGTGNYLYFENGKLTSWQD